MSVRREGGDGEIQYSVVVPVCNEAENVEPLVREIEAAMNGRAYEMVFVDDGSTDDTATILFRLTSAIPSLRVLRHSFRSGQSAAVCSGVRAARGKWIATLDGDGQNDPADIPNLLAAWTKASDGAPPLGVVGGMSGNLGEALGKTATLGFHCRIISASGSVETVTACTPRKARKSEAT